jgi:HSP90 family molecular chaperone
MNNNDKIEVLNSTNENSSFHKIFDVNLEHKLIDNLHNISNNKLSEIIELSYNNYIKKEEDEEILLKKNNIV